MFARCSIKAKLTLTTVATSTIVLITAAAILLAYDLNSFKQSLADDLRATSTKLDSLLDKASNGRGTTGRLMNDAGLYDDMRKSLQRIDSLMADFQKNPRKYIKLSIF